MRSATGRPKRWSRTCRAEERLALKAAEQNAAERLKQNTAAEAVEGVVPWQPWQPWF